MSEPYWVKITTYFEKSTTYMSTQWVHCVYMIVYNWMVIPHGNDYVV